MNNYINKNMPQMTATLSRLSNQMNDIDKNINQIKRALNGYIDPRIVKMMRNVNQLSYNLNSIRTNLNDVLFSDIKMMQANTRLINEIYGTHQSGIAQCVMENVASDKSITKDVKEMINNHIKSMNNVISSVKPILKAVLHVHIDSQVDAVSTNLDQIDSVMNQVTDNIIVMMDKMLNCVRQLIDSKTFDDEFER